VKAQSSEKVATIRINDCWMVSCPPKTISASADIVPKKLRGSSSGRSTQSKNSRYTLHW
ncbi:unnamed protein product, partial [Allacma fusca]